MIRKIKDLIAENKLEEAKKEIEILEFKLSEELSKNRQCTLIKEISDLKKLYFSKLKIELDFIKEKPKYNYTVEKKIENRADKIIIDRIISDEIDFNNIFRDKIIIENKENVEIEKYDCLEAKIDNCKNIKTDLIKCSNSILINNVINSTIKCQSTQVRLIDCYNVKLIVFTKTGIFLQNCKNITIKPLEINLENNKYNEVFDFTNPLSKNYLIIE